MKRSLAVAALLLTASCTGDVISPEPVPSENPAPKPPNRAPVVASTIPAQSLAGPGARAVVDVTAHFSDPDGDTLTFAASSDTTAVRVSVEGAVVSVLAWATGTDTVTVTARDPGGLQVQTDFEATVTKHPDRAALVALYEATDGPNWVNSENWLTDAPLGEWFGVQTNASGRVTRLDMGYYDPQLDQWMNNGVSGPIPPELGDLTDLTHLRFFNNRLSGPIPPEIGKLTNLIELDFYLNDLTGSIPPELGNLSRLDHLLLSGNDLSGPIPSEIGNLVILTLLWLQDNDLSGPIPPEIGKLTRLDDLHLHDNALTGPIPSEIGNLARMETLNLSANTLTGPIPPEIGNLARLKYLDLHDNALTGPIPPEFSSLANLETLSLDEEHYCDLTDPQLQAWLLEKEFLHPLTCHTAPMVDDPYPIRLHWAECGQRVYDASCVPVDDPRGRYGDMIVSAAEEAAAEWARVLHPTPRTGWLAPAEGWDRINRGTPPELWGIVPGDSVPPGVDVLVAGVTNQESCGWTCATGSPVKGPGGYFDHVRMAHLVVDSRFTSPGDQLWVNLHELGHAFAMSGVGLPEWSEHIVKLPLSPVQREVLQKLWPDRQSDNVWVQTHPEIVEIYEHNGGGAWEWIGQEMGVAMDPHGWSHWNDCAAPQDVMGPWYFHLHGPGQDGPRWRTWISPLTAIAATVHGGFKVDLGQVRPADYHVPNHWSGKPDCETLAR